MDPINKFGRFEAMDLPLQTVPMKAIAHTKENQKKTKSMLPDVF